MKTIPFTSRPPCRRTAACAAAVFALFCALPSAHAAKHPKPPATYYWANVQSQTPGTLLHIHTRHRKKIGCRFTSANEDELHCTLKNHTVVTVARTDIERVTRPGNLGFAAEMGGVGFLGGGVAGILATGQTQDPDFARDIVYSAAGGAVALFLIFLHPTTLYRAGP